MKIIYKINEPIKVEEFQRVLNNSTLAERRPVEDVECLKGMLENSNLVVSAWLGDELVGISRAVTDFHYCCYLSDLAVDTKLQSSGVGKQLQRLTQKQLGPKCNLILLAAPAAHGYYKHLGFNQNERCWVLERNQRIK